VLVVVLVLDRFSVLGCDDAGFLLVLVLALLVVANNSNDDHEDGDQQGFAL
jgi:hypothetical protein